MFATEIHLSEQIQWEYRATHAGFPLTTNTQINCIQKYMINNRTTASFRTICLYRVTFYHVIQCCRLAGPGWPGQVLNPGRLNLVRSFLHHLPFQTLSFTNKDFTSLPACYNTLSLWISFSREPEAAWACYEYVSTRVHIWDLTYFPSARLRLRNRG